MAGSILNILLILEGGSEITADVGLWAEFPRF